MNVKKILDELVNGLPEIYDGFIYEENKGVVASHLSLIAKEESCEELFQKVMKISTMASVHYNDICGFTLCFGNTKLLARPANQFWLFLVHAEDASAEIIKRLVGTAVEALKMDPGSVAWESEVVDEDKPLFSIEIEDNSVKTLLEEKYVDIEKLMRPGSVIFEDVEKMKGILGKIVGPISAIVVEDALSSWAQSYEAIPGNIGKIYPYIEEELDDREQFAKFMEQLSKAS